MWLVGASHWSCLDSVRCRVRLVEDRPLLGDGGSLLFRLSSPALVVVIIVVIAGPTAIGVLVGHRVRLTREGLREPTSIIQPALLGFVGLLLAFGLTMAVDRYGSRRSAVVDEANAIGTTYLRAQTLTEPERSASLKLLKQYTDARLALSRSAPGTPPSPVRRS